MHGEAGLFQETAIEGWRRVEASCCGFGVDVECGEGGLECGADGCDIAVAAHLGDEAATGPKGAMNACESCLLAGKTRDPVEGGVGEDGVELLVVGEGGGVVMFDLETTYTGGCEHGGGGVDAGEDGSGGGELLG